jgi:hypothetical protein
MPANRWTACAMTGIHEDVCHGSVHGNDLSRLWNKYSEPNPRNPGITVIPAHGACFRIQFLGYPRASQGSVGELIVQPPLIDLHDRGEMDDIKFCSSILIDGETVQRLEPLPQLGGVAVAIALGDGIIKGKVLVEDALNLRDGRIPDKVRDLLSNRDALLPVHVHLIALVQGVLPRSPDRCVLLAPKREPERSDGGGSRKA